MNRHHSYDESYYIRKDLRWLNSRLGRLIKLYYRYLASHTMANAVQIEENGRVLDIGCGVGTLVQQFNKLGYRAIGVDVHPEAIRNSIAPDDCRLVTSTAQLDFPDRHFDLVVSREVLEHIPAEHIDDCIREWTRVSKGKMVHIIAVKERGKSATCDPTHINVQSETWWIDKFREHGYREVKTPKMFFFSPFGSKGYLRFVTDTVSTPPTRSASSVA